VLVFPDCDLVLLHLLVEGCAVDRGEPRKARRNVVARRSSLDMGPSRAMLALVLGVAVVCDGQRKPESASASR
jgi:hypothetical protein